MTVDILSLLKSSLNFTTERVQPSDGQWGSLITNTSNVTKQWNGLVKMLLDGNADISTAALTITKARAEVSEKET